MIEISRASPLAAAYRGRRVLLVGGTGFLGSVTLSLLLQRLPELERLHLVLRRRPGLGAERRFLERILPGVAFDPLRERFGEESLREMVREKVEVYEGDVGHDLLGLAPEVVERLSGALDLVINCSGLVDFHAPLERAYRVNVLGASNLVALCERTGAALVHTSTAFVAGRRGGRVEEVVEPGSFPRRDELPYVRFDAEQEVADLLEELERIGSASRGQAAVARFTEQAIARYRESNDSYPSPSHLENAVRRAQRDWISAEQVEAGRRRAEFWGWPNAYTYSKALGEQLIAASGVRAAIVRPTVVESALAYPVPGWNQNATTSAPLVMLALAGFSMLPGTAEQVLDLIPVDQVAWAMVAVGAATLNGTQHGVYHVGTSDTNPLSLRRITDLVGIYTHTRELDDAAEDGLLRRLWKGNRELRLVSEEQFRRRAALVERLTRAALRESARIRDRARHRQVRALLGEMRDRVESVGGEMERAAALWDVFLPFSHDLDYRFATGNIRALAEALTADAVEEELPVAFDPRGVDWRTYWLEVHIPGLRRWVLSEANPARVARVASAVVPFADRLESLAARDGYRRALGYGVGARPFALTYAELWSAAGSLARSLEARTMTPGARVGVLHDPAEPWPIAMVAALRAGHEAVLVPAEAWEREPAVFGGLQLACTVRMRGPRSAEVMVAGGGGSGSGSGGGDGSGDGGRVEVHGEAREVENRAGVSSTPRGGLVAWAVAGAGGWEIGRRIDSSVLSRELAEIGAVLALGDDARAVLPADAGSHAEAVTLAVTTLALLYHGVRSEVVRSAELVETVEEVAPTIAVLGAAALREQAAAERVAGVGSVERIVDVGGAAAAAALEGVERRALRLARVESDPATGGARATLLGSGGEEEGVERATLPSLRSAAALTSGLAGGAPHEFLPGLALGSAAVVGNGRSPRAVLVVPELEPIETLQALRERILEEVHGFNARVDLASRIGTVGISLVPRERLATDLESDGRVLWLATRRRDAATPVPEVLLRESVLLLSALFDAAELEFFVRHLLAEPLDDERLRVWERVLLDGARRGGLPAQVFLQCFDSEMERRGSASYRVASRVGGAVERVRDWLHAEDPEGKLLPEPVSVAVRAGIGGAIHTFFRYGMRTTVLGAAYVPPTENFLVVANHSSHLDAGLVQYALGEWRHRLHTLAAKDYFFSTPFRRFVAHHFTRLIPTDRQRVSSDWLRRARDLLAAGECVLIFPEGTRSDGPEVRPFKASIGTLVRSARVPVLPVYVEGSDRALPKGRAVPRHRDVRVHVGPPLTPQVIAAATAGVPGLKQDRAIAVLLQHAVASVPRQDFWWLRGVPEERARLLLPGAAGQEVGD
jgi:1-acyl-sn-glycerol-3-phosphate acyltransferase